MNRNFFAVFVVMIMINLGACIREKQNDRWILKGDIKGFTKGQVYISKLKDTVFVKVDSAEVSGKGIFTLSDTLSAPQVYYLKIKEIPDDSLLLFAEPGEMKITGNLKYFFIKNKVEGSENHRLLEEYKNMTRQFQGAELDMVKAHFEASKAGDSIKADSINRAYRGLLKRKYLYTANYAVKHADKAIAPYLALTRLYDARLSLLDTVNKSLKGEGKNSPYGKQLEQLISFLKKNEEI